MCHGNQKMLISTRLRHASDDFSTCGFVSTLGLATEVWLMEAKTQFDRWRLKVKFHKIMKIVVIPGFWSKTIAGLPPNAVTITGWRETVWSNVCWQKQHHIQYTKNCTTKHSWNTKFAEAEQQNHHIFITHKLQIIIYILCTKFKLVKVNKLTKVDSIHCNGSSIFSITFLIQQHRWWATPISRRM